MLIKEKIFDLIDGRLSDQAAYEYLSMMQESDLNAEMLATIIERVRAGGQFDGIDKMPEFDHAFDCAGTGGSGVAHFNTSTAVAFILAAGGVKVAKSGNRATSSASGSFDLLQRLGFTAAIGSVHASAIISRTNLVFLFAPQFYPTLAKLGPVRKSIGKRTIFNILGPLLNPVKPKKRLLGAATAATQDLMSEYLATDGRTECAFVVNSNSGMDDLDPAGDSQLIEVTPRSIIRRKIKGKDFDSRLIECGERSVIDQEINSRETNGYRNTSEPLTPEMNERIFYALLDNECDFVYFHELVCLNAGAAFAAAGSVANIEEGKELASDLLKSGAVKTKLEECRRVYAKFVK